MTTEKTEKTETTEKNSTMTLTYVPRSQINHVQPLFRPIYAHGREN